MTKSDLPFNFDATRAEVRRSLEILSKKGRHFDFVIIEDPASELWLQVRKWDDGTEEHIEIGFPLCAWSFPYEERLRAFLRDRRITFDTLEHDIDFLMIGRDLPPDRLADLCFEIFADVFQLDPPQRFELKSTLLKVYWAKKHMALVGKYGVSGLLSLMTILAGSIFLYRQGLSPPTFPPTSMLAVGLDAVFLVALAGTFIWNKVCGRAANDYVRQNPQLVASTAKPPPDYALVLRGMILGYFVFLLLYFSLRLGFHAGLLP